MSKIKKKILLLGTFITIGATALTGFKKSGNDTSKAYECQKEIKEINLENNFKQTPKIKVMPKKENTSRKKAIIFTKNNKEVMKYTKCKKIGFNHVRQELKNNHKIQGFYSQEIGEIINELEKKVPNVDLTCLYHNLKKLKIEEIPTEEVYKRTGENMNGYFVAKDHRLVINKTNLDRKRVIHREVIHMLNHLWLETKNYIVHRNYVNRKNMGRGYQEGMFEWINEYLFPHSELNGHLLQKNDTEIIRNILNKDKQEFIEEYVNSDIDGLYNDLAKYVNFDFKQLDEFFKYSNQELLEEKIDVKKAQNKYDTLLEAIIVSRSGVLNPYEIYDIAKLFNRSTDCYLSSRYQDSLNSGLNISNEMPKRVMETLSHYGLNVKNDLTITEENDDKMIYLNKDQLYFGYKQVGDDKYQYTLIEEYLDDKERYRYVNLNSLLQDDLSNYNIISIHDLVNNIEDYKQISMEELTQIFIDRYFSEKQHQKKKKHQYLK